VPLLAVDDGIAAFVAAESGVTAPEGGDKLE